MPPQLHIYTATDGFRVGSSPPDYVCEIPQRRTLEQNSIIFFVDQRPRQAACYTRGNNTQKRQLVPVARSTRDKVCADHENALILNNSTVRTEWNLSPHRAILRTIPCCYERTPTQTILPHMDSARRQRGWDSRKGREGHVEVLGGD
jgi:hypothetical protein